MFPQKRSIKKRVAVFIDGFNVYHYLANSESLSRYKWLDYRKLAEYFIPTDSSIVAVKYFTALATWDNKKVNRHNVYIRALKSKGIEVIIGRFKHVKRNFIIRDDSSTREYKTRDGVILGKLVKGYIFEEKKTDVSIAITMLSMAFKDEYDLALLLSGDTDFEPVIQEILSKEVNKEVILAVPNRRHAGSLRHMVGKSNCISIKEYHLRNSQLDNPIELLDGKKLWKPDSWK